MNLNLSHILSIIPQFYGCGIKFYYLANNSISIFGNLFFLLFVMHAKMIFTFYTARFSSFLVQLICWFSNDRKESGPMNWYLCLFSALVNMLLRLTHLKFVPFMISVIFFSLIFSPPSSLLFLLFWSAHFSDTYICLLSLSHSLTHFLHLFIFFFIIFFQEGRSPSLSLLFFLLNFGAEGKVNLRLD